MPLRAIWTLLLLLPGIFALAAECQPSPPANHFMYIALGDSLSAGVGASDPATTAFVPRVYGELGAGYELLNLGVSGSTSSGLLDNGTLDRAVDEITSRNSDDDDTNDVQLVTLEIGGNDLLAFYFSLVLTGICPNVEVSLEKPECTGPFQDALDRYEPNLDAALDALQGADPSVPIVLLTLYKPLEDNEATGGLGELSLEGQDGTEFPLGFNDIIRRKADEHDIIVADVYLRFRGHAADLISGDFIHPNDAGHEVMARAVTDVLP